MSTFSISLAVATAVALIGWVFYLIFGQVTVRKLERNPELRQQLGFEPISGWRILNVAEALVLPMSFFNRVKNGQLGWMFADAALIRAHTNKLDRVLAHLLVWTFFGAGASLLVLVCLDALRLMN